MLAIVHPIRLRLLKDYCMVNSLLFILMVAIKETGLYLNGLREGMWEEFSLSNEKSIGTYRHGYRNGEWRYYNSQGKLVFWKRFDAKGRETEKYSFAGN